MVQLYKNRGIRTMLIFELQHLYTVFLQASICTQKVQVNTYQTLQNQLYSIHNLVDLNVWISVHMIIGLLLYITYLAKIVALPTSARQVEVYNNAFKNTKEQYNNTIYPPML